MKTAYICQGGNFTDTETKFNESLSLILQLSGVESAVCSEIYLTEPQGKKDQPWFQNRVIELACLDFLTAPDFLRQLLLIEDKLGRKRKPEDHFAPRCIDLDLLLFNNEIHQEDAFCLLPHPRMQERAFVLYPLSTIAPDLTMPDGRTIQDLLSKLVYRIEGKQIFQ